MNRPFYTHKQVLLLQAITAVLAVAVLVLTGYAQIPAVPVAYLPIIANAQTAPQSTCNNTPIQLTDTGDLDAMLLSDGSYIIAYQNRQDNSRIHVARHEGNALVELPLAPGLADLPVPEFTPTGPKQGSVALVAGAAGKSRLYFTQRVPDENGQTPNEGPYAIWCMSF